MAPAGLTSSLLAAVQASISVLLVMFYGGIAAHFKLLDAKTASKISKICVRMFLPALLFVKLGSEMRIESAKNYGIIVIWAISCHLLSFLIGLLGRFGLGMPDWIVAAIMFNNTTSYPLLLIQSLDETGILKSLVKDESTSTAIERAKSYFLVFATISSCLTFSVGPRLIDAEHAPEMPSKEELEQLDQEQEQEEDRANESTRLLSAHGLAESYRRASAAFAFSRPRVEREEAQNLLWDRRPHFVSQRRWLDLHPRTKWWLLFLWDFFNAPLLGAAAGAVVGLAPPLHRAFFNDTSDGGIFTAWLTASLKTIGPLFVPLPVIVAGISLYASYCQSRDGSQENHVPTTPWSTTLFILLVRFVIWPVISISVIYGLAKRTNVLGSDTMLWFTLMLMPTGPPASKLITMIQVSGADIEDEQIVARLLMISYAVSPILAFTVAISVSASQAAVSG